MTYRLTPDPLADMHTASGVPVYLREPWRTAILSRDLRAHSAATRYNGAPPVTILQHSVLVAALAQAAGESRHIVQHCAAHDLAEAVPLGEIVTGIKRLLPEYLELERIWEPRIRDAVGVGTDYPSEVKRRVKVYDLRALACELWWHRHPVLAIKPFASPDRSERWITRSVFWPVVGAESVLWERLCGWLPRLREDGPL
jgi:hypothetical protein